MKAILEQASMEEGSIVAAGAVVTPGTVVGAGQVLVVRVLRSKLALCIHLGTSLTLCTLG